MSGVADLLAALMASALRLIAGPFGAQDVQFGPATALAAVTFESDGDVISTTSVGAVDAGDWIAPKAAAPGTYEIMAHLESGSITTGTLDTWMALSSSRAWQIEQLVVGSTTAVLTISIRQGSTVLATGTVSLEATVN